MFDDLHLWWGNHFFERWPDTDRVPVARYRDLVALGPATRVAHATGLAPEPIFEPQAASDFFAQLAQPDCTRGRSGWPAASSRLATVASARWARTFGRPDVADLVVDRNPEAFVVDDQLHDDLAWLVLEQAKQAYVHGMPRSGAIAMVARAQRLARSSQLRHQTDDALRRFGDDIALLPRQPSVDALAAALPDDLYFPKRQWTPDHPPPSWATHSGLQPRSPGWELVALGWQALPALAPALDATTMTRRYVTTTTGLDRSYLVTRTHGELARTVVYTITGRSFAGRAAYDRWWVSVGHKGPAAAWRALVAQPTDHTLVDRLVPALLALQPVEGLAAIEAAVADPTHPRRDDLLLGLANGEGDPTRNLPQQLLGPVRVLGTRYVRDNNRNVRLAAAYLLSTQGDADSLRHAAVALQAELRAPVLTEDQQRLWWDAVDQLDLADPTQATAVVAVARNDTVSGVGDGAEDWESSSVPQRD